MRVELTAAKSWPDCAAIRRLLMGLGHQIVLAHPPLGGVRQPYDVDLTVRAALSKGAEAEST